MAILPTLILPHCLTVFVFTCLWVLMRNLLLLICCDWSASRRICILHEVIRGYSVQISCFRAVMYMQGSQPLMLSFLRPRSCRSSSACHLPSSLFAHQLVHSGFPLPRWCHAHVPMLSIPVTHWCLLEATQRLHRILSKSQIRKGFLGGRMTALQMRM